MEYVIGFLALMNVLTMLVLALAKKEYREDIQSIKSDIRNIHMELYGRHGESRIGKIYDDMYNLIHVNYNTGHCDYTSKLDDVNNRIDDLPQVINKKKQDRLEEIKQELESMEE